MPAPSMMFAITPSILAAPVLLGAAWMLLLLAYQDLSSRRLPNTWVGIYAALFLLYAWASGMGWQQLGGHVITAMAAMGLLVVLFILRAMGGGDVKLWTALMLWAGPSGAGMAVLIASFCGLLLGLLGWAIQHLPRARPGQVRPGRVRPGHARSGRARPSWRSIRVLRMLTAARGVPYGVGLALAGLHNLLSASL